MTIPGSLPARRSRGRFLWLLLPCSFVLTGGCVSLPGMNLFKEPAAPPGPAQSLVLRGDKLEEEQPGIAAKPTKTSPKLEGAKELFRRGDYAAAQKVFHLIASDTKNTPQIAEEALYYEAEALRLQRLYPKAGDTYSKLLKEFPTGQFREQATQRVFDISNYWLDDTRTIMEAARQKKTGWFSGIMPASYIHWDKTKPLFDEEGWALEKMEEIKTDLTNPLADKALFYLGSVKFFHKDYKEADQAYTQLAEYIPNSPLAAQAIKMAIVCKQLSTGGSDYDGRKTAEARELIMRAKNFPELNKEQDFFVRQIVSINAQQADKDLKIAEFYQRTGHPGSAYFYYEIVKRRYPGTTYHDKAVKRIAELEGQKDRTPAKPRTPVVDKAMPVTKSAAPAPVPGTPLLKRDLLEQDSPRPLPADLTGGR